MKKTFDADDAKRMTRAQLIEALALQKFQTAAANANALHTRAQLEEAQTRLATAERELGGFTHQRDRRRLAHRLRKSEGRESALLAMLHRLVMRP